MITRKGSATTPSSSDEELKIKGSETPPSNVNNDEEELKITIHVKIGNKIIEEDLEKSIHIPRFDKLNTVVISELLAENPSLHARWNYLYNEAVYENDVLKTKYDVWLSRRSSEIRKELQNLDGGKVTEKMIDEMIKLDPEYKVQNDDLSRAKKNVNHIKAMAIGIGEKGERLVNIASMMKWELENLNRSNFNNKTPKDRPVGNRIKDEEDYEIDAKKNGGWPTK